MGSEGTIRLKPGREKSALHRHPWVFSGAIARVEGKPEAGATVEVIASDGRWLAYGAFSPASQIAVRLYSWDVAAPLSPELLADRIRAAAALRTSLGIPGLTTAYRLVNAESDLLPGLIVDRYGEFLVLQALSTGADKWKAAVAEALCSLMSPSGIYERSDAEVRTKEGLDKITGRLVGAEPPENVTVTENGLRFLVNVRSGHKTGLYLDQRENRLRVGAGCAGRSVLNVFAYTGGFGVYAAAAGAGSVTHVDSSGEALALAARNIELNPACDGTEQEYVEGNAFSVLRAFRAQGRTFDVIILDPPKFAESAGQVTRALNGYKDINLVALQLLSPGGTLATFSCSGLVSASVFQQVVWEAALDAHRDCRITARLSQSADHPVLLNFPEGEYLKGLILQA